MRLSLKDAAEVAEALEGKAGIEREVICVSRWNLNDVLMRKLREHLERGDAPDFTVLVLQHPRRLR